MLTRIFGLHGCGKSSFVYEKLNECIKNKKHSFLIVPEQQAVSAERTLIDKFGNPANMYIEVINFKRLCNRVFRESGGIVEKVPDSVSCQMAMSHVLANVADNLKEYSLLAEDADFALKMLKMTNYMHSGRISPEMLEEIIPGLEERGMTGLSRKIQDIILAYRAYTAFTEQTLDFPGDLLDKLYETLCSYDFFAGKTVFIDSFYGFTAQELAIIEKIIVSAENVYITFLCKGEKQDDKCFERGTSAALSCGRIANKHGVELKDVFLTGNTKHNASPAIKRIAQSFSLSAIRPERLEKALPGLEIYSCENIYKEAQFACAKAMSLMMGGVKPREIAICARDIKEYDGILDVAFENAGIPFSADKSVDLSATPVASLVCAAFEIYFTWSLQAFVAYIKTGLSGLSDKQADELEIYMRTWNISGKKYFHEQWLMNPDGLSVQTPDTEKLLRLNESKDLILSCLDGFCDNLDNAKCASDIARAAYTLVNDIKRVSGNENFVNQQNGEHFDLFYRVLDSAFDTVGNELMTPKRFYELFKSVMKNMSSGKIPELIDQVRFSDISLMRTDGIKYVIILGVNDGVFPKPKSSGEMFGDGEIKTLCSLGIELEKNSDDAAYDEIFLAYTALCSASDGVFITYRKQSSSSDNMYASIIVNLVSSLVGAGILEYSGNDALECAVSDEVLFENYLTMPVGVQRETVRTYFMEKSDYRERILASEKEDSSYTRLSAKNTGALYGKDMISSYSRLEKYRSCPFSFFCRYTLKLSSEPTSELGSIEIGNTVHKVLEELIPVFTKRAANGELSEDEIETEVKSALQKMLEMIMPAKTSASTKRFEYLFSRLEGALTSLCLELTRELKVSKFVPVDCELSISPDGDVKPASIPLEDGRTLSIVGQIDRVDIFHDEKTGFDWVRITDYKTGAKKFSLEDIRLGFNLQMLLYLYTLTASESKKYGKLYPAGVMYRVVKRPDGRAELGKASEDGFTEPDESGEISGVVVTDPEVIFAMDSSGSGKFIPVKLDGKDEKAMSVDELGALLEEAVVIAANLANEMASGNKRAEPCRENSHDPCAYCEYSSICRQAEPARNSESGI